MEILNIEKNAKNYGIPVIRTESHNFLQNLVKKVQPKNILEIGTAVGFSGILMLSECDGNLTTIEHNKDYVKQAKKNFAKNKMLSRVKIVEGDCMVEIAKMVASEKYNEHFDMIFLDGPKAQYNLLLPSLVLLLKQGGTFVADNVLFRGYIQGESTAPTKRYKTIIKRLNEFLENCKNNPNLTDFCLETIEDGIVVAKKVIKWNTNKSNF